MNKAQLSRAYKSPITRVLEATTRSWDSPGAKNIRRFASTSVSVFLSNTLEPPRGEIWKSWIKIDGDCQQLGFTAESLWRSPFYPLRSPRKSSRARKCSKREGRRMFFLFDSRVISESPANLNEARRWNRLILSALALRRKALKRQMCKLEKALAHTKLSFEQEKNLS